MCPETSSDLTISGLQDTPYLTTPREQAPALGDAAYEWQSASSKSGLSYDIGTKKTCYSMESHSELVATAKKAFGIVVDWPLGSNEWKETTPEVRSVAGISRYKLHSSSHPLFDFVLEFTNTESYNYNFLDKTGDSYSVNTYEGEDHLVRFSSRSSTISFITGS